MTIEEKNNKLTTGNTMHTIPLIDIRNTTPEALVHLHPEKALNLLHASRNAFGIASRLAAPLALPFGDKLGTKWLNKTNNPYKQEIFAYQTTLNTKGIVALNLCYEWGCTSSVFEMDSTPTLLRVLDWPFPALGENMVVTHQTGSAGDFYNVTWPAMAGVFTAMAQGRFACALNQAPMRRYLGSVVTSWIRNRVHAHRHHGLPPAHLLRLVFETAPDYDGAKHMLCHTPVCVPVIYILSGTKEGEGCVIERLEDSFAVRDMHTGKVVAANHFETHLNSVGFGWMPRAWGEIKSHHRSECAKNLTENELKQGFDWFKFPIANPLSRLALKANAALGTLELIGTDGTTPITTVFTL
jgi:hypothetical protein